VLPVFLWIYFRPTVLSDGSQLKDFVYFNYVPLQKVDEKPLTNGHLPTLPVKDEPSPFLSAHCFSCLPIFQPLVLQVPLVHQEDDECSLQQNFLLRNQGSIS
jgi:hypothetical protein